MYGVRPASMSALANTRPATEERLARARERHSLAPEHRERVVETVSSALFVVGAALLLLIDQPPAPALGTAVLLTVLYGIALRVEFEAGTGFTVPTVAVLFPMLFLLPPAWAPVLVVIAQTANYLLNVARGKRHVGRIAVVCSQSWNALGAAVVLAALDPGPASWDVAPAALAAFVAYVATDAIASLGVDHFGLREPLKPLLRPAGWVYFTDMLLAPVGFAIAIASVGHPLGVLTLVPAGWLLRQFAKERKRRIDHVFELSQAYRGTALLLGDVIESDDSYTGSHSRDVVRFAVAVGTKLGLAGARLRDLEFAALLHDVGKIAVPKEILNKPGPLDDGEWELMRRHTIEGERMLNGIGGVLADVGRIVRSSHERVDGKGYPDGLAGEEIPIEARICAVCDAWSAMTTDRPYRRRLTRAEAEAELARCAGSQFDPDVVAILLSVLDADDRASSQDGSASP